ncbi:MAG: spore coat U domain-containing protein [Xanthomonadaceae bacterium]|nr:spore coat U domain-containing protein [Xanthomonadaceae bacterium]
MLVLTLASASMPALAQQCAIQSVTPLAFGAYDPTAVAPDDATGAFEVRCSPRTSYRARISTGASGGFFPRTMVQGPNALAYNLFREAARVTVWGDGSGGTQVVTVGDSGPPGNPVTVTIFGRVPAGQWVAAGTYTDTLDVTIEF